VRAFRYGVAGIRPSLCQVFRDKPLKSLLRRASKFIYERLFPWRQVGNCARGINVLFAMANEQFAGGSVEV